MEDKEKYNDMYQFIYFLLQEHKGIGLIQHLERLILIE